MSLALLTVRLAQLVEPLARELPTEEGVADPAVKAQLKDPAIGGPGVLAWLVVGCLEY